jgi:hypothetical protein
MSDTISLLRETRDALDGTMQRIRELAGVPQRCEGCQRVTRCPAIFDQEECDEDGLYQGRRPNAQMLRLQERAADIDQRHKRAGSGIVW